MVEPSILLSTKKALNLDPEYEHFDQDIIMHINTAIMALVQIGIGPSTGFLVTSKNETWFEYIDNEMMYAPVKSYIYLKTRLLFDPPDNSFLRDAINEQLKEIEWRLFVENDKRVI